MKVKKQTLSVLLVAGLLASSIPFFSENIPKVAITANASQLTNISVLDEVKTENEVIKGECGENVTWTFSDGVLTISGIGEMTDWENYDKVPWYNLHWNIRKVIIENGVTSIGNSAFSLCQYLETIVIPESVKIIKNSAFMNCSSLSSITIPNSVSTIEANAFSVCRTLKSITIPNSVTTLGENVFNSCTSLESITIPNSVKLIGKNAFNNCTVLESVTLPDSVTDIGVGLFYKCSSLTSVTLSSSLTEIGYDTFYECSSLKTLKIPEFVGKIGDRAFYGCTSLESISVDSENEYFSDLDGVLFNKDKTKLIYYPSNKKAKEYIIPESVTVIERNAFYGCISLVSATLTDSVRSISSGAFSLCHNLNKITILNPECSIFDSKSTICNDDNNGIYTYDGAIYGYNNSTAEKYAKNNGRTFVTLGDSPVTTTIKKPQITTTSISTTTANNVADSKIIKELEEKISALESENTALKEEVEQLKNALTANVFGDIDGNNIIDGRDASMLLTYYAKTSTGYTGTLADFVESTKTES